MNITDVEFSKMVAERQALTSSKLEHLLDHGELESEDLEYFIPCHCVVDGQVFASVFDTMTGIYAFAAFKVSDIKAHITCVTPETIAKMAAVEQEHFKKKLVN